MAAHGTTSTTITCATGPALPTTTIESWIRQRAVANRLQAIMDLFCEHLSQSPQGERLTAPDATATSGQEYVRNMTRGVALGMAARLGLDLGLYTTDLFGKGARGRTEIIELRPFHGGSVMRALANFDALRADRSEFGRLVDARYRVLVESARAEVDDEERRRKVGRFNLSRPSAA